MSFQSWVDAAVIMAFVAVFAGGAATVAAIVYVFVMWRKNEYGFRRPGGHRVDADAGGSGEDTQDG
jgi:hypothetical protein